MTKPGPKELRQRALGQSRLPNGRFMAQGVPAVSKRALAWHPNDPLPASSINDTIEQRNERNRRYLERENNHTPQPHTDDMIPIDGGLPLGHRATIQRSPEGFDRRAYQRVYCRLRRKHGPVGDWPACALAELRLVSKGRSL